MGGVLSVIAMSSTYTPFSLAQSIDLKANELPIHTSVSAEAKSKIPSDYKFRNPGEFTVAVSVGTAPLVMMSEDSSQIIGLEPDIARLIADGLGLKLKLVRTSWEEWPLGVQSGRYDAFMTNVTVTKERKERFDFASYRIDTLGFYVKTSSKIDKINQAKDISGKRIIVSSGTNQEEILLSWNKENKSANLPEAKIIYFNDTSTRDLMLKSGRADAYFGPNVSGAFSAAKDGQTRLVGLVSGGYPAEAPIAVTLRKGTGFVNAVQASIDDAIKSGKYDEVLKRWANESERVSKSEINPKGLGD
ncbi:ABC transporter substrate-binding protein [Serratia marcescens]|nr:ABC transporter substrate-binding protein [Serratia marcescens]